MTKTILFFDTETTGFAKYNRAPTDPSQPHVVQLAAQLFTEDAKPISGFSVIIDPGVEIPEVVTEIHGIDNERASAFGVKPETAVRLFEHLLKRADLLVAHNIKFDLAIMRTATERVLRTFDDSVPTYCTMEAATPVINLPPTEKMKAAGFGKPKPPKLAECINHFFDEDLEGAHDAMVDVTACARVYFHLQQLAQGVAA